MELPSKHEKQSCIQAINKNAVHQICSGQVVLNLATAVKELVENSLDAGASVIEIRLKEYGSELVEVIDNGSGVEEDNFQALTLKHHTSKLREFSDLMSVETFGFRGEALSSLCALSEMTITTWHTSASCGTKLEFDHRGQILRKKPCARQVGTTVSLQNLFSPLPVRHKEFHRNLRREFAKMTQHLYAYCLVSTGTKISCSNQTKKGGRTIVASTQGSKTVRENIASVFGAKQVQSLMEVQQKNPSEKLLQEFGIPEGLASAENPFQLEGYISSCAHGQGRSATDRQFFFVNSRPCEPAKVIKIVNEVYHQFNQHQYPFVYLNMKMARSNVDVNVTPDKRQVFLDHEKFLIATIKNISPDPVPQIPSSSIETTPNLTERFKHWSRSPINDQSGSPTSRLGTRKSCKRSLDSTRNEDNGKKKLHCINHFFSPIQERSKNTFVKDQHSINNSLDFEQTSSISKNDKIIESANVNHVADINDIVPVQNLEKDRQLEFNERKIEHTNYEIDTDAIKQSTEHDIVIINEKLSDDESEKDPVITTRTGFQDMQDVNFILRCQTTGTSEEIKSLCEIEDSNDRTQTVVKIDDEKVDGINRKTVHLPVNIDDIKCKMEELNKKNAKKGDHEMSVKFRAEIDPTKNQSAEHELRKEISKDMFAKMEILGQFNLGFIVTRLGSDLFIIDQHATDEKYNFEMLQQNTVLQNQRLVIPQKLELTAVNESILIENEAIFRKNGFDFITDETAEPTKRVQMTAIPVSKNWQFGKEDVDELLFMLQDSPHTMCRPSRVRAMFASRACRKSVMIGTALSKADMRRLVDHMGQIEQPWNCPHGRPTMRHLVNLDLIHNG